MTLVCANLEEKILQFKLEDETNSKILQPEEFSHYCNQRRLTYLQLGREIENERKDIFHQILAPLKIKPIVKRDLKTIIGGLSLGIIVGPFSLLAISGYLGYKSLFKIETKHGDQYTMFGLAIPLTELGYAISEIRNPKPIAYKITNKSYLKTNNISKNRLGISLISESNEIFNPDYIKIKGDNTYPLELHFPNGISFSLNTGFNNTNSLESKKNNLFYFEADQLQIEKLEQFKKITQIYIETYNQLDTLENVQYPRLIEPTPNWVKATAL